MSSTVSSTSWCHTTSGCSGSRTASGAPSERTKLDMISTCTSSRLALFRSPRLCPGLRLVPRGSGHGLTSYKRFLFNRGHSVRLDSHPRHQKPPSAAGYAVNQDYAWKASQPTRRLAFEPPIILEIQSQPRVLIPWCIHRASLCRSAKMFRDFLREVVGGLKIPSK